MAQTFFGKDYDSVQLGGGSKPLPAGGYICRIIKARLTNSRDGLPMVEALFDICDGEYTNYFSDKHRANMQNNPQAEYPKNGRAKVIAIDENGNTKKTFKGFCTSIEKSNGITLPREDNAFLNALTGKLIGVIFGREEFQGSDGDMHWVTKPRWYRTVEDIQNGNYDVPDDTFAQRGSSSGSGFDSSSFNSVVDDIPF